MVTLTAYDASGAPLNVTPTWATCIDATTGAAASEPVITALGGGMYGITAPDDVAGVVDFGATALPRYAVLHSSSVTVVAAFDVDGEPLSGLSPTWLSWRSLGGSGAVTPQPTITELSGGLYRVNDPADGAVGVLSFGPTALPRTVTVGVPLESGGGGDDPMPPVVIIVSPPIGTRIGANTPLVLDVTDNVALRNVILYARFSGRVAAEVVHDGGCFLAPYTASSRSNLANGFQFTLRRQGGWPGSPSLSVRAFDTAGNEGQ